jgi:hypothetical protein
MISLIITLAIVGVLLWAVETLLPIAPPIKRVIDVVVVLAVLIYLLRYFGVAFAVLAYSLRTFAVA